MIHVCTIPQPCMCGTMGTIMDLANLECMGHAAITITVSTSHIIILIIIFSNDLSVSSG